MLRRPPARSRRSPRSRPVGLDACATRPTTPRDHQECCRPAVAPDVRPAPRRACACRCRCRRRPCYACSSSSSLPCDANPWFLQPSGPDEEPIAILLRNSPKGCGGNDPTIGGPARVAARAGPFLTERPQNIRFALIQGASEASLEGRRPRHVPRLVPVDALGPCDFREARLRRAPQDDGARLMPAA